MTTGLVNQKGMSESDRIDDVRLPELSRKGLSPRKTGIGKCFRGPFRIPKSMRILYISDSSDNIDWLLKAFRSDKSSRVEMVQAIGSTEGLSFLRESVYDAVLINHRPNEIDALEIISGFRTGGAILPTVVLGEKPDPDFRTACYQIGADEYLCIHSTTVRNLLWTIARAMKRFYLEEENCRLEKQRLQTWNREKDEAQLMLTEQQDVCRKVSEICLQNTSQTSQTTETEQPLPEELKNLYAELLKTYIIMGTGSLTRELSVLAEKMSHCGIRASQTMAMHVEIVARLVQELGGRSTRHIMARADLLIIELFVHLSEKYQYQVIK